MGSRREEDQGAEQGRSAEQGGAREANAPPYVRVKQEEDLMWLQETCQKWVRSMLVKGFVREKWVSFNLRTVKFPSYTDFLGEKGYFDPEL